MRELNECRELTIDELDQVSGGDKVEVTQEQYDNILKHLMAEADAAKASLAKGGVIGTCPK
jgi:bacteriocin-like protein